jgi:hypothetical protein
MSNSKMVSVPEEAVRKLDQLIHILYRDRYFWLTYAHEANEWGYNEKGDKNRAKSAKEVAKAFGLYPYNQDEVRCP